MEELSLEELEKVSGGEETPSETRNIIVKYREEGNCMQLTHDLGKYEITYAETNGETMAQQWCTENNMIYDGWYLADLKTDNYNTRILLDTITKSY